MKQIFITLSFLLGLATSVSANDKPFEVGDVFFCETLKFVEWDWNDEPKFKNYRPERFKFSIIDEKTIKFGKGTSFNDYEMSIEYMIWPFLKAGTDYSKLTLHENEFGFVQALSQFTRLQVATCDRF